MTTEPAFTQPRLPKQAQEASRRLLSSALACRIAIDLADVSQARKWAHEVLTVLDDLDESTNSAHQRAVKHHQPELWAGNGS